MLVDTRAGNRRPRTLTQDTTPYPQPPWQSHLLSNFSPQAGSHISLLPSPPPQLLTWITGVVPTLGGQAPAGRSRGPQMRRPAVFMVPKPGVILGNRSWRSQHRNQDHGLWG